MSRVVPFRKRSFPATASHLSSRSTAVSVTVLNTVFMVQTVTFHSLSLMIPGSVHEKPTITFRFDLWAQPLQFATPPTYEEIVPSGDPMPAGLQRPGKSVIRLTQEFWKELLSEAELEARKRRVVEEGRVMKNNPFRLELHMIVHPPPRNPAPLTSNGGNARSQVCVSWLADSRTPIVAGTDLCA